MRQSTPQKLRASNLIVLTEYKVFLEKCKQKLVAISLKSGAAISGKLLLIATGYLPRLQVEKPIKIQNNGNSENKHFNNLAFD